ncbi:MAG TPA: hypothetical protein VGB66_19230, partial [Longimicrobium sp.]
MSVSVAAQVLLVAAAMGDSASPAPGARDLRAFCDSFFAAEVRAHPGLAVAVAIVGRGAPLVEAGYGVAPG